MAKRRQSSLDGPTDISVLLGRLLARPEIQSGVESQRLLLLWPEVVGEAVSKAVNIHEIRDGILLLHTDSGVWKSEVNWQKKAILERSNALLGAPVVRDLRFI